MRSARVLLVAAGLLVVIGLGLVLFENETVIGSSFGPAGGDAAVYSSEVGFAFDGAWLVSTQAVIGYGLVWLGSLLTAGVVGFRVAARLSPSV
ncbi:hypothetical protein [Aeromicrobium chenweiae]|uniref:Uncharacterized protein n=1 Tax=Aeromicrobium chenweiae TaxID=2079793 RepID=A0A2S0WKR0_9ACTN|nr:hypothetical protein [Aeromicrobium chenweiae]AWB91911.1 hypothetical protein C3E78_06690 [Aeromicrobium chenweiae]TGN32760.1 hypothetical protein E4L97_08660 [Aeromicrobium chenweiae]